MTTKQSTKKGGTKGKAGGSRRKKDERLQPRDDREQQLVDETLEHADEILAARAASDLRAAITSPHTTAEQKTAAKTAASRLAYGQTAYRRALAHFDATEGKANRFTRSLLVIDYDRDDPEAVALAVRIPGSFKDDCQLEAETLREWSADVEFIARILEHPGCPEPLAQAVGAIYTEMLDGGNVSWMTPAVMRVMLPLVLLDYYRRGMPAEADTTREIFLTLCQELGGKVRDEVLPSFTNKD
jgi:hypothetical protein